MTVFLILCAVMLSLAVTLVILPLWRTSEDPSAATARRVSLVLPVAIGLPIAALLLYSTWSNFDWDAPTTAHGAEQTAQMEDLLAQLEERLTTYPNDVEGWVMLARSRVAMGDFSRGASAYAKAYELTGGDNPDIATGFAEALALVDESELSSRAGQIFEDTLKASPDHPKALWYGSIIALRAGDLPLARERMQRLLAQSPPEQVRSVLERQIADISAQLGESPTRLAEAPPAEQPAATDAPTARDEATSRGPAAATGATVAVDVSIAPALAARLDAPRPVFVLARDANAPGPPLAAARRMTNELPFIVELSDANAMIAGRTMTSAGRIEIVARISRSGTPTAQSGDLFGTTTYAVDEGSGRVAVVIDQVVP